MTDADSSTQDQARDLSASALLPEQLDDEVPPPPPPQRRRRKLPAVTIALAIAAAAGIGFFAGVRVEKAQLPSSSARSSTGFAAAAAANRRAPTASPSADAGRSGAFGADANPDAVGGAANIVGTITVVQGDTLYVTDTATGNVVKVTTTDGTTVTKTDTGAVKDLTPGETVVIRGVESSAGVYAAQSVTQGTAGAANGFSGFGGRGGRGGQPSTATSTPTPAGAG